MISARVNGENLTSFQSGVVTRSIETVCGHFELVSSSDNEGLFPVKVQDLVEILLDGHVVLTGYVDNISGNYSQNSHLIRMRGRDVLQDLVDSSMPETKTFTGGTLESITKTVLKELGLTEIKIINNAGAIEPFDSTETESAEIGANAFEFIECYARKRQVLLTTDGLKNLVFARGTTTPATSKLTMKKGRNDNSIKSVTFSKDYLNRFYKYKVASQQSLSFLDTLFNKQVVDQKGESFDEAVRTTRYFELSGEDSMKSETALERATWEANYRRTNSLTYSPIIQGHLDQTNKPWTPNTLVSVDDDYANETGDKLIKAVRSMYSVDGGSTTQLTLVPKDAYTLQATQSTRDSQRSEDMSLF
ncbi:MAG: hypothetical protein GY834_09965 [Bacteroidetes bacterium]|nr:hypothetical protein [Bacteroidota bacterium]